MFRLVASQLSRAAQGAVVGRSATNVVAARFCHAGIPDIYDPNFDSEYEQYFTRPDIDGWEIRKGMSELLRMDLIPDPKIITAALHACRRVNDYSLTTRYTNNFPIDTVLSNDMGYSKTEQISYEHDNLILTSLLVCFDDSQMHVCELHRCRRKKRTNDILYVVYFANFRWLEGVKNRCGGDEQTYNWIINEIRPTLVELGVSTPEELGFGAPELALKRPHEY